MVQIKKYIDKTIEYILIGFITIITVLILAQILFRTIGFQALWISEFVRYVFIYLVFFGSAISISEKGHIVIDTIVGKLSQKTRKYVSIFVHVLVIIFLVIVIWSCITLIDSSGGSKAVTMNWFKTSYLYIGVLISSILMIFYSICEVYILLVQDGSYEGEK